MVFALLSGDETRCLLSCVYFPYCIVLQLDESGNPKESMNIHGSDDNEQNQAKSVKSPVVIATLSSPKNFTPAQVTPLPAAEGNQDTLTVSLESTGIVPHPDAGISEVIYYWD